MEINQSTEWTDNEAWSELKHYVTQMAWIRRIPQGSFTMQHTHKLKMKTTKCECYVNYVLLYSTFNCIKVKVDLSEYLVSTLSHSGNVFIYLTGLTVVRYTLIVWICVQTACCCSYLYLYLYLFDPIIIQIYTNIICCCKFSTPYKVCLEFWGRWFI